MRKAIALSLLMLACGRRPLTLSADNPDAQASPSTGGAAGAPLGGFAGGSASPAPDPDTLVAHWSFDDLGAGDRVRDVSGHGHFGLLLDSNTLSPLKSQTWTSGFQGAALMFSGIPGPVMVVDLPTRSASPFARGQVTATLWVKSDGAGVNPDASLLEHTQIDGNDASFRLFLRGDFIGASIGATEHVVRAPLTREWTFLALVYDGTATVVYIGDQVLIRMPAQPMPLPTGPLLLGAGANPTNVRMPIAHRFRGAIDEVRLYATALDRDQLNAIIGRTGSRRRHE